MTLLGIAGASWMICFAGIIGIIMWNLKKDGIDIFEDEEA